MTGRRLYDHHVDALRAVKRDRWVPSTCRYERAYPDKLPIAWPFLSDDERKMWNEMARRITPRPKRR